MPFSTLISRNDSIAGTTYITVIFASSIALIVGAGGINDGARAMHAPIVKGSTIVTVKPKEWKLGRTARKISSLFRL